MLVDYQSRLSLEVEVRLGHRSANGSYTYHLISDLDSFGVDLPMSASTDGQAWQNLTVAGGAPLPEWAQFMLDLGRGSGAASSAMPNRVVWRIVTVPNRNFAAGLFALGFLEASLERIFQTIDSQDVTKLAPGQSITWMKTAGTIAFGTFIGYEPARQDEPEDSIRYQPATGPETRRTISGCKRWHLAPYYGSAFVHARAMSRNLDFFRSYFPSGHEALLCHTVPTLCLIGRPALWDDLRAHELAVGDMTGCLDDLLRVSGDNENAAEDVSHYLTRFISPDRDALEELAVDCAIFDGSRSYPKLKNFVSASQNLVVLDRWESGALDSANAFAADCAHAGTSMTDGNLRIPIPSTIEYSEWSSSSS